MLEDAQSERLQRQRRKSWVQRPNEVFVKPLRLLDLEANSFDRLELLARQVYNESDTQVI